MTYDRNCVLCNPHKDPEQRIVLENETCFFLQRDSQQDILEGSGSFLSSTVKTLLK